MISAAVENRLFLLARARPVMFWAAVSPDLATDDWHGFRTTKAVDLSGELPFARDKRVSLEKCGLALGPGGVTHESPLASCAAQRQKSSWVSTSQLCNPLAKSGSKARNVLAARDHRQTGAMRLKAAAGSRWAKSQMITWPMPVECRESHRTGARREGVHCKAQLLETSKLT
jgi:hypothetical protein